MTFNMFDFNKFKPNAPKYTEELKKISEDAIDTLDVTLEAFLNLRKFKEQDKLKDLQTALSKNGNKDAIDFISNLSIYKDPTSNERSVLKKLQILMHSDKQISNIGWLINNKRTVDSMRKMFNFISETYKDSTTTTRKLLKELQYMLKIIGANNEATYFSEEEIKRQADEVERLRQEAAEAERLHKETEAKKAAEAERLRKETEAKKAAEAKRLRQETLAIEADATNQPERKTISATNPCSIDRLLAELNAVTANKNAVLFNNKHCISSLSHDEQAKIGEYVRGTTSNEVFEQFNPTLRTIIGTREILRSLNGG